MLVLAPWSLSLLTNPSALLTEAGLDLGTGEASGLDLLGISPGGPGAAGGILLLGIVLAALAALLREERQFAVRTAWAVALVAFLFAAVASGSTWAGPATLVYGTALIAAALVGADGARIRVAEQSFGWRQPVAALIALAAGLAPVLAAAGWMIGGADGPLERRDPVQVPAFVAEESTTRDQPRTLILGGTSPDTVSYSLVRGSGARLGDGELTEAGGSNSHLDKVVANLVAGSGADQGGQLSGFAIRYVLVRDGAPREMSRVLDSTPGLSRLSQLDGSALWRVDRQVARVMITPASGEGERVAVGSAAVEAHSEIPSGEAGRVLRIADAADPGWSATLDGKPLTRKTVDGWAQGFELPANGGRLDLTHDAPITHTAWIWAQIGLLVVLVVMALPGRRREIDDDLPDEALAVAAEPVDGEGRRARRLRAAAQAEAAVAESAAEDAADPGSTSRRSSPPTRTPRTPGARPAGGHRRLCGGPAAAGGSAAVRRVRAVGRTAAAADRRLLRGVPAAGPVRPAATAGAAGAGERRLPGRLRSPGPVRAAVRRPGHVQRPRRVQRSGRLRRPGHVRRPGRRVQRPGRVRRVRPVRRRAAAPAAPVHRERRTDRPSGPSGQAPWQTGNASRGESE